jgi:hypothetical protein
MRVLQPPPRAPSTPNSPPSFPPPTLGFLSDDTMSRETSGIGRSVAMRMPRCWTSDVKMVGAYFFVDWRPRQGSRKDHCKHHAASSTAGPFVIFITTIEPLGHNALYPPSGTKSISEACIGRQPFKISLIMTRLSFPSPVRANLAGSDLSSAFLSTTSHSSIPFLSYVGLTLYAVLFI